MVSASKTRRNLFILIVICIALFIFCAVNLGKNYSATRIDSFANNGHVLEDYIVYAAYKRNFEASESNSDSLRDNPICGNRRNRTALVMQYRNLVQKIAAQPSYNPSPSVNNEDVCLIPDTIMNSDKLTNMATRLNALQTVCEGKENDAELNVSPDQDEDLKVLQDSHHHFSVCLNAKAASSSLHKYGQALGVFNVVDHYLTELKEKTGRETFKNMKHPVLLHHEDTRRLIDLNTVLVRHPFQRALSCYTNKVYYVNFYKTEEKNKGIYNKMIYFSKLSPNIAVNEILEEIKLSGKNGGEEMELKEIQCKGDLRIEDSDSVNNRNYTLVSSSRGKPIPSFRGFVLALASSFLVCRKNPDCIGAYDRHIKSQTMRCSPCNTNFDAILKVETLTEDIKYIEALLNLPPVWDVQQNALAAKELNNVFAEEGEDGTVFKSNSREKEYTYQEYMSTLTRDEINLLYTVYYNDFKVFDYDPCDELYL